MRWACWFRIPVHPRERGEQPPDSEWQTGVHGSSPRTRGTDQLPEEFNQRGRFIPANAGNRLIIVPTFYVTPVHPRERGEQPHAGDHRDTYARFIPANAGNRFPLTKPITLSTVHPRERGEQCCHVYAITLQGGSSPRTRGTASNGAGLRWVHRFIPANAGNSFVSSGMWPLTSVHPRERGEQFAHCPENGFEFGSSPRTRGTALENGFGIVSIRFIPANAGNRIFAGDDLIPVPVHPRERGEQPDRDRAAQSVRGSSPRTRGTEKDANL